MNNADSANANGSNSKQSLNKFMLLHSTCIVIQIVLLKILRLE